MTNTLTLTTAVDTHLEAYGTADADARAALIERVWAQDGKLVDPPLVGDGHAGVAQAADALQSQFPGHTFRRASGIDDHHGFFRYGWELVGPDGAVAVAGTDVGAVDEEGRLLRVVGFFGELPAREDA